MKYNRRLISQLYPSYLVIILISLAATAWYTLTAFESFFLEQTKEALHIRGRLLEKQVARLMSPIECREIDDLCKKAGVSSDTRITVVLPDGLVIGDSEENPSHMNNHKNRPEILTALSGGIGSSVRDSETLGIKMMYVAMPLKIKGDIRGVIRTAIPVTAINETIYRTQLKVILVGLLIALLASVISLMISRRISRPLEEMKEGADRFAIGNLSHRLHKPSTLELSSLAEAMNRMAAQLEERIATVISQRNEYEAVLSSMIEGVIAMDREEHILSINQAALDIFDIPQKEIKNKTIQEIIRNLAFHKFLAAKAALDDPQQEDFLIHQKGDKVVNIHTVPLRNSAQERIGTLIVINDVTKIRRLENMRKDFVANVSHEIKTPLTAIKGFVETLLHDDDENPEKRGEFLEIIMRHVDRLNSLVVDLLSLSRIEQMDDNNKIEFEQRRIRNVIETAIQVVQAKADNKGIRIEVFCNEEITALMDSPLFEQALVNLIDNAIKYSPENSRVFVYAMMDNNGITLQVKDKGPGIPEEHLSRLFERFYRVDKARSRKLGGTGLGLAIVKHVIAVHGGTVSVESSPGKGSTFIINLPVSSGNI